MHFKEDEFQGEIWGVGYASSFGKPRMLVPADFQILLVTPFYLKMYNDLTSVWDTTKAFFKNSGVKIDNLMFRMHYIAR